MVETFPQATSPFLYQIALACVSPGIPFPNMNHLINHFKTSKYDHAAAELIGFLIEQRARGHCLLSATTLEDIIIALLNNPNNRPYQAYFYYRYAVFQALDKNYAAAVETVEQAIFLKDSIKLRLQQIRWLIYDHQFDKAEQALEKIYTIISPLKKHIFREKLEAMAEQINTARQHYQTSSQQMCRP